ncbi:cation:proton antiporter [Aestuariivirga sp.]|uniref:cation:proton antiporter n=1 Tax=Aestuariivirga sp. TaxID=2650926 RepID=UPI003BA88C5C
MDAYVTLLAVLGGVILVTAWLPAVLKRLPLSLPIACIAIGILLALSPVSYLVSSNPLESRILTERLTEFVVIVSLMGAGLKLDRPLSWRGWMSTWRLLAIAMPLTIAGVALLGWSMLGLSAASALLLGAALAPTDPVLASDVQVGRPNGEKEDDVRFALTSEAGLNDALAFPFVYLAIALAQQPADGGSWFMHWLSLDVAWRLAAGLGMGWLVGRALGYLTFQAPETTRLAKTRDGFVAIGTMFLCYGLTELVHGYGFLAVFVSAVTLRSVERKHSYHEHLHDFTEQIERLFMMVILVFFGAAMAEGTIFGALNWKVALAAVLIILLVRPLSAMASLAGYAAPTDQRAVIAFYGIRGLGSFYYLAYALGHAEFAGSAVLWATVCITVLFSIIIHGITATPVMALVDGRRRGKEWSRPA